MGAPPDILQRSASLPVFLMLRYLDEQDTLESNLADHLDWMVSLEREGRILLSGPVRPEGPGGLVGLTVIRADSEAAARGIAEADPLVRCGYVRFELCSWTAFEGAFLLDVRLSDSSVRFR